MEQPTYLLDTNVVIDYLGNRLPHSAMTFLNDIIDAGPRLSVITKIELLGFPAPDLYARLIAEMVADSLILPLSEDAAQICIDIRKTYRIKLPDAIIAARLLRINRFF